MSSDRRPGRIALPARPAHAARRARPALPALAAAALLLPGIAAAQPGASFCPELRRVVAAASEPEPFASLIHARPAVPGLGFLYGCMRSGDARQYFWLCTQTLAPPDLSGEGLAEAIQRCLPAAAESAAPRQRRWRFAAGGIVVRVSEGGSERAHVGRSVTLVVEGRPAPRPAG